jgi:hypothetical protein
MRRLIASRYWCSPSRVEVRTGPVHAPAPAPSPVPRLELLQALAVVPPPLAAGLAPAEDRIWIQEFLAKATAG